MLAAGGTGGHLFPAFALAEELARRGIAVDLVTDMRGDRYGTGLSRAQRLSGAVGDARRQVAGRHGAARPSLLARGVAAAFKLLGQIKPRVVVGFGGYPTFPPLLAARLRGIPTALHEQNAVLGRANRMLAKRRHGDRHLVRARRSISTAGAGRQSRASPAIRCATSVIEAAERPYPAPDARWPLSLLVFGGSQGARYFSDARAAGAGAAADGNPRSRLEVVQQAARRTSSAVAAAYRASRHRGRGRAPSSRICPSAWRSPISSIGRAGASTVAELAVIGRPSILVPLPHALDNDQLQNASRLAESGGGLVYRAEGSDAGAAGRRDRNV